MKGSLGAGEYPLLSPNQSLSNYEMCSFPRIKFKDGLQTEVEVPYDVNLLNSNVANLNGRFYWVTTFRQKTAESDQYTLTLDYMGPTSEYRTGDTVTGNWHKLPYPYCWYLPERFTNAGDMISSLRYPSGLDIEQLIDTSGADYYGFWVQVTGFADTGPSGATQLRRVGFFVGYSTYEDSLSDIHMPAYERTQQEGGGIEVYPSYADLIADITAVTGIQANNVVDCSVSRRCPYPVSYTNIGGGLKIARIKDRNNNVITPTLYGQNRIYNLNDYNLVDNVVTYDITWNTDFAKHVEHYYIRDWNGNNLMEIPKLGRYGVTVEFRVHADYSGIYTIVTVGEQKISIPEGKLPFIENNWETYKAYQMDADRMAMQNAIEFARYNKETADISGIANTAINAVNTGVMTGVIGGKGAGAAMGIVTGVAGGAVTLWENQRALDLSIMQAEANQKLSEKRAATSPETGYNVGYGMVYCKLNMLQSLAIATQKPIDRDSSDYTRWCNAVGYAVEGIIDAEIETGYYQGVLLDRYGGMFADRTNETFMRGFRFVDP